MVCQDIWGENGKNILWSCLYTPDGLNDTHDPHHDCRARHRHSKNVGWEKGGPQILCPWKIEKGFPPTTGTPGLTSQARARPFC